jgi:RNA polymerase sigma-70 factor, ECF subfamily
MGVRETDLEDATQRVFLIAVSKLDRIRPGSERAYLYSTAVRLARRIRRSPREMGSEPDAHELVDPGATPEAALEHRQSVALLDRVLERLPDELKEVFLLCEVEELTMREVSELLAVPSGTVASRRRRAREELRRGIERAKAQVQRRGHP